MDLDNLPDERDSPDYIPQLQSLSYLPKLTLVTAADTETVDGLTRTKRLPYKEWRGVRQPTEEFGQPGDVYLNLTPGSYAVYGRYNKLWMRWESVEKKGPFEERGYLPHPFLTDKYLWVHHCGAVWLTRSSIQEKTRLIRDRDYPKAVSTFVSELLEYERRHSKVSSGSKRVLLVDDDADEGNASKKSRLEEEEDESEDSQPSSAYQSERDSVTSPLTVGSVNSSLGAFY